MSDNWFGGGGAKPVVQNSTSAPWDAAQPHLQGLMNRATDVSGNNSAFQTYQGPVTAPLNNYSQYAMDDLWNTSFAPVQGLDYANSFAQSMMANNGMNAGTTNAANNLWGISSSADGLTDAMRQNLGYLNPLAAGNGLTGEQQQNAGYLNPLASGDGLTEAQRQNAGYLNPIAGSSDGLNEQLRQTANYFHPIAGSADGLTDDLRQTANYLRPTASGQTQEDPRFQKMLDTNANRAAMQGAAMASAKGRYASGAMGKDMADRIGEQNNALMYQNNQAERQNQLQASGMLQGLYDAGMGRKLQAGGQLQNLYDTGLARKLQASNQLQNIYDSGTGRKLQASGQLQDIYDTGTARKLQASGQMQNIYDAGQQRKIQSSGMLGDLYGQGMNRAQNAMGMLPTLDALKYSGADRRAQVGDFYQNRAQDEHNANIEQQNAALGMPKAQVEWLSGIMNGMGKLGGSSSGTTVDYGKKKSGAEQLAGGLGLLGLFL